MKQTRLVSIIESCINTLFGFLLSFLVWPIAALLTGVTYTGGQHWAIVTIFTVVSVGRSYAIRRFFNNGFHRIALKLVRLTRPLPPEET